MVLSRSSTAATSGCAATDGVYHRDDMGTRLSITEEEKDKLYSIRDFWKGKTVSAHMDSWYPDGFEEWCAIGASSYFPGVPIGDLPSGHLTAGYPKILNVGYAAIRKQAAGLGGRASRRSDGRRRGEVPVLQVRGGGLRRRHGDDPALRGGLPTAKPGTCADPGAPGRAGEDGRRPGLDRGEAGPHLLGGRAGHGHVPAAALHGRPLSGAGLRPLRPVHLAVPRGRPRCRAPHPGPRRTRSSTPSS